MNSEEYDETRIKVMIKFLQSQGERGTAEFVINLQDGVEGLLRNLSAYEKEFKRLSAEHSHEPDAQSRAGYAGR